MGLAIIIIVIVFAIAIPIGISQGKKNKELLEEGKIMRRDYRFPENGEEFTSKIGSFRNLHDALDKADFGVSTEGNTAKLQFKGNQFAAVLYRVSFDEPSGTAVYRFEFTSMQMDGSVYKDSIAMNYVLTTVEKVFLGLDPNTVVKTYKVDYKTKHSLF